jgi:RNA methyltransferase, TrmH family
VITSPRNPRVAEARRLRRRAEREHKHCFLLEGREAVADALRCGAVLEMFVSREPPGDQESLASQARNAGIDVHEVPAAVMRRLTTTVTPQGPVAVCAFIDVPIEHLATSGGPVLLLVEVRDPGNLGTILRTADAAGASGVIVSTRSVDVYNDKAVRASAGSLFHVCVVREADPADVMGTLRRRGLTILAAASDGRWDLYDPRVGAALRGPVAVVLGNEARGLDAGVRALTDQVVRIPMTGRAESLNLAVAAAVVLFEAARQRAQGSSPTIGGSPE